MVFTNDEASQLHLIYPTFEGIRPTLRRMVIERDLPRRTAVMQVANIFHEWERRDSIHLALESAFDVEAVTREFFKEYKRVFDTALDKISGFGTGRTPNRRPRSSSHRRCSTASCSSISYHGRAG